jgi:predicted acetyltransferase
MSFTYDPATLISETTMQMTLLPAAASHKPALAKLIQFYHYDLSEVNGAEVDEHGRFDAARLDAYWTEAECHPFLIRVDQRLAGFALVHRQSRLHNSFSGHSMADFFVMRRHRRQGVGRTAATLLFDRFPGAWEVSATAKNVPGHVFWRSVVDHYTGGHYDETWLQTAAWRGTVESFVAPPPR